MNKKISLVTHEEVQKHLANHSPSKHSFRFSKSKRFKDNNPQCPIAFYSNKSQLSPTHYSIGNAKKIDFLVHPETPGSNLYNPDAYYAYIKSKGLSFGLSRQQSPDKSYLIPQIHKHPSPFDYENQRMKYNNSSYSIRPKTMDTIQRHLSYKQTPGPGAYQTVDLSPKKIDIKVSKFKNPQMGITLSSLRFPNAKQTPGPHSYHELDNLSSTAKYTLSSRRGNGTRPFTREKRFTHNHWRCSKNPSPCHYEKNSEFGIYGDSTYYKNLSTID